MSDAAHDPREALFVLCLASSCHVSSPPPNETSRSSKPPTSSPPSSTTSLQRATNPSVTTASIPNDRDDRDDGAYRATLADDQGMDPRRRTGSRLVQPSAETIQSRSRRLRPKPDMETRGNPTGRRQNAGFRIHLIPPGDLKKTAAKRNLGKAVWRATLATNECDRQNQKRPSRHCCCVAFFFSAHCSLGTFHFFRPPFPCPPVLS